MIFTSAKANEREEKEMFVSDNLGVNAQGNLTIGGVDTVALAKKYGTPLYVMDEDMIRRDCRIFRKSMETY